ncbi:hypothetical protein COP2_035470 [Malus domestica]
MADSAILPTKGCEGEVSRKGNSDFTLKEWLVSLEENKEIKSQLLKLTNSMSVNENGRLLANTQANPKGVNSTETEFKHAKSVITLRSGKIIDTTPLPKEVEKTKSNNKLYKLKESKNDKEYHVPVPFQRALPPLKKAHRFSLGGCRDEAFLWLFKSGLQLSELKNVEIVISDTEMERLRVLRFQTEVDGLQVPADVPFLEQCFWVHIHGLPSVFTTKEMGEVIVAAMGRCVTVDCENDLCFDEFMHIKVAIDVFKPLRRGVQLRLPSLEGSGLIEAGQSARRCECKWRVEYGGVVIFPVVGYNFGWPIGGGGNEVGVGGKEILVLDVGNGMQPMVADASVLLGGLFLISMSPSFFKGWNAQVGGRRSKKMAYRMVRQIGKRVVSCNLSKPVDLELKGTMATGLKRIKEVDLATRTMDSASLKKLCSSSSVGSAGMHTHHL